MERDKKVRRPRIGEDKGASHDGNTEKYEKINYGNRDEDSFNPEKKPRVIFNNDRGGNTYQPYGDRKPFNRPNNNYSQNKSNYAPRYGEERSNNNYSNDRPLNKPRVIRKSDSDYNNDRPYQPRVNKPTFGNSENGGNRPYNNRSSEGGYQQHGYGNNNRGGGYNNNRNSEGGYQQRSYGNNNRSGGYNNNRSSEGGYQQRSYGNNNDRKPFNRPQQRNNSFTDKPETRHRIEYVDTTIDLTQPIRLNKYMANAGICSRREADEFIQAGKVKVNGIVMNELGTKITRNDEITFQDKPISLESKLYVLLNKPKDCVTTSDDPQGRLTVMDIVRNACTERIYPVGRLDRNTTGVLLLTNDGDLASKLTHPKFVKKKIYHVWTDRDVTEDDMQKIADGIELDDGPIHADAVSYATDTDKNQVGIEIHSGRNRIVRRIFESLGYRVIKLDRVYFAGLTKKNLQRGRWRYLTQQEVTMLKMGSFE